MPATDAQWDRYRRPLEAWKRFGGKVPERPDVKPGGRRRGSSEVPWAVRVIYGDRTFEWKPVRSEAEGLELAKKLRARGGAEVAVLQMGSRRRMRTSSPVWDSSLQ